MKRLVIHAGVHRTGTTSIQATLANNRELLRENNCEYPGDKNNHQSWAWSLFRKNADIREFLDFLLASDAETIVISGEDFCIHRNLDWLDEVKQRFEVSVHLFLRRQDDWLTSWYNQHLKWPFNREKSRMTPMQFLDTLPDYYWLDYLWLADNWANKVGTDNLHLGVSSRENLDRLSKSISETLQLVEAPVQNDSMSFDTLEVVRLMGFYDLSHRGRTKVLNGLRQMAAGKPMLKQVYPANVRKMIVSKFEESNKNLAEKYFGKSSVFSDSYEDDGVYAGDLPTSNELLTQVIGPLMRAMFNP